MGQSTKEESSKSEKTKLPDQMVPVDERYISMATPNNSSNNLDTDELSSRFSGISLSKDSMTNVELASSGEESESDEEDEDQLVRGERLKRGPINGVPVSFMGNSEDYFSVQDQFNQNKSKRTYDNSEDQYYKYQKPFQANDLRAKWLNNSFQMNGGTVSIKRENYEVDNKTIPNLFLQSSIAFKQDHHHQSDQENTLNDLMAIVQKDNIENMYSHSSREDSHIKSVEKSRIKSIEDNLKNTCFGYSTPPPQCVPQLSDSSCLLYDVADSLNINSVEAENNQQLNSNYDQMLLLQHSAYVSMNNNTQNQIHSIKQNARIDGASIVNASPYMNQQFINSHIGMNESNQSLPVMTSGSVTQFPGLPNYGNHEQILMNHNSAQQPINVCNTTQHLNTGNQGPMLMNQINHQNQVINSGIANHLITNVGASGPSITNTANPGQSLSNVSSPGQTLSNVSSPRQAISNTGSPGKVIPNVRSPGQQVILDVGSPGQQGIPSVGSPGQQGLTSVGSPGQQGLTSVGSPGQQGITSVGSPGQQGITSVGSPGQQGITSVGSPGQQGITSVGSPNQTFSNIASPCESIVNTGSPFQAVPNDLSPGQFMTDVDSPSQTLLNDDEQEQIFRNVNSKSQTSNGQGGWIHSIDQAQNQTPVSLPCSLNSSKSLICSQASEFLSKTGAIYSSPSQPVVINGNASNIQTPTIVTQPLQCPTTSQSTPISSPLLLLNPSPLYIMSSTPNALILVQNAPKSAKTTPKRILPKPPIADIKPSSELLNATKKGKANFCTDPNGKSGASHQSLARQCVASRSDEELLNVDFEGNNYLHAAVCITDANMVKALIERIKTMNKIEIINDCNHFNQTPLYLAVSNNKAAIVCELVRNGANPNILAEIKLSETERRKRSALHCAVTQGKDFTLTLKQLFESKKIDPNIKNCEGLTPLLNAIKEHGRIVSKNNTNVMIDNCINVSLLLKNGANPEIFDGRNGETPLMCAIESKDVNIVEAIVKHVDAAKLRKLLSAKSFNGRTCSSIAEELHTKYEPAMYRKLTSILSLNK